jgi:hypothetical protein
MSPEPTTSASADSLPSWNFLQAWKWLLDHPALVWVPPLWRTTSAHAIGGTRHTVRAVERNLTVTVEMGPGGPLIQLITGPLEDRTSRDGSVDPLIPAAVRDERLIVQAGSFEEAVVALAATVAQVYGDRQTPSEG